MPILLEWGEEIDFSCVCVAETVLLLLLPLCTLLLWWIPCTCSPPTPHIHSASNQMHIWNLVRGLWWSFFFSFFFSETVYMLRPLAVFAEELCLTEKDVWRNSKCDSVYGEGFHHWGYTGELLFRRIYIANIGFV